MLPQQSGSLSGGCCHGGPPAPSPSRRGWEIAAGALSISVWILMPKCPVCLAAHVALWTGLGLSFAEATYVRWSLLSLSGVLLCYLIAKRIRAQWLCHAPRDIATDGSTMPVNIQPGILADEVGSIAPNLD